MILRTNYKQEEGKILIYDDIQNTETPQRSYGTEEDDGHSYQDSNDSGTGSSSHRDLADQRFYGRHPNVLPQQYSVSDIRDYKLDTIQEGGSSVSSGGRSLNNSRGINFTNANLEDVNTSNLSSQKCKGILNSTHGSQCNKKILKTDTDYQVYQQQFNNQKFYFPVQGQIYYHTQTSNAGSSPKNVNNNNNNNSTQSPNNTAYQRYGHNSFIYEVNQMRLQDTNLTDLFNIATRNKDQFEMKRSFGNPKTPINLLNTQQMKEFSSNNSNYMFNSDERQVKKGGCSSSRYRYDSKEDDEEDEEYQYQFQIRQQDEVGSNNENCDQNLPKMPIQYLEYPISTSNKSSQQNESGDLQNNSILSFPANTAQKHQYSQYYQNSNNNLSDHDSSKVAEVSIAKAGAVLNNNLNINGLRQQYKQQQNSHINNNVIYNDSTRPNNNNHENPIILLRHSHQQSSRLQVNRGSSVLTQTTIPDDESALMDERPIVNVMNYFSKQVSVNKENSNSNSNIGSQLYNFQRSPKISKAPQMKGDTGDEELYQSFNFSDDQSFEIRDRDTNKVLLRASIQQTQRHLRKISQMLESQKSQRALFEQNIQIQYSSSSDKEIGCGGQISKTINSVEQGNTEESEVPPDTDRDVIAGQRISVIKSILQKMLIMQSSQRNDDPRDIQTQWSKDEMLALTDIFKNIVNTEIENKQQTTKATLNSTENTYLKVSQLEQQNQRLARENQELKNRLRQQSQKKQSTMMMNINDENYYQSDEDDESHMSRNHSIKSNTHQISSDYLLKEQKNFENVKRGQQCHSNRCINNRTSKMLCTDCEKMQNKRAANTATQVKPQTLQNSAKLTRATNTNANNSSRGSFINQQNSVSTNATAIELNKKLNSLNASENLGLKKKDLKPKVQSSKNSQRKQNGGTVPGNGVLSQNNFNTTQKVSSFLKQ